MKIGLLFIFFMSISKSAYAYLDPGSASLILQGILAAIVGGVATLGIYWTKFKVFISRFFNLKSNSNNDK
ncbi:hypothetical protein N9V16_01900 [SAR116 cluster bacterium]|nr:hypothetical protein [SAR116 cluster bacterium]